MTDRSLPHRWTTRFGECLTLRRIDAGDVERSEVFLNALSYGTRYFRFGRGDFVYTPEELARLCQVGAIEGMHVVATHMANGRESIVGSARWVPVTEAGECEFTVVVDDGWHRRGLGHRLMRVLIDDATDRGLSRMTGKILASNRAMINFVEALGFGLDADPMPGPVRRVSRPLTR